MGVCEYEHIDGNKLSPKQLDIRYEDGWELYRHHTTNTDSDTVHHYIFKRKKD